MSFSTIFADLWDIAWGPSEKARESMLSMREEIEHSDRVIDAYQTEVTNLRKHVEALKKELDEAQRDRDRLRKGVIELMWGAASLADGLYVRHGMDFTDGPPDDTRVSAPGPRMQPVQCGSDKCRRAMSWVRESGVPVAPTDPGATT